MAQRLLPGPAPAGAELDAWSNKVERAGLATYASK